MGSTPRCQQGDELILTVREDKNGGAKHIQKTNHLTVDKSKGPFVVTYPNQEYITWYVGESVTISWDVVIPIRDGQLQIS
jgi:hypothetical protein